MPYFDHNATSPPDPRVVEAMLPWWIERHGNPSSVHRYGQQARAAIEEARSQVAELLGADAIDVVFLSSGTEANNAVLEGVLPTTRTEGPLPHMVVSAFEHPSILECSARLQGCGAAEVTRVVPKSTGVLDPKAVLEAVTSDTRLVCVMLANNEIGTIQPVREIVSMLEEQGVRRPAVLCDAVQAAGKIPVRIDELGADWVVIGGHKFHGPLGAAALWTRPGRDLRPLLVGGGQERRRRASTENVPAIVGFGVACQLAHRELPARSRYLESLRAVFERGVASIDGAIVHCRESPRLPHTSHVAIAGVRGEDLVIRLDLKGHAVSTGAACASGVVKPSATVLALGVSEQEALSSIRVSFGMPNTRQEVEQLLEDLANEVAALTDRSRASSSPRSPGSGASALPNSARGLM